MSLVVYPSYRTIHPMVTDDSFSTIYQSGNFLSSNSTNFCPSQNFSSISSFPSFAQAQNISEIPWSINNINFSGQWISSVNSSDTSEAGKVNFNELLTVTGRSENFKQTSWENCSVCAQSEKNLQIWRPFSPTPILQDVPSSAEGTNTADRRRYCRNGNRVTFPSITPSKVKIEASKTSVFKAVKKRNHYCSRCSSSYLNNAQLTSHMRIHTGSKPYICDYPSCAKTFARNEELTRHRRIHSGYKPHICSACDKRFGRKDHLSKHLKTHLQVSEKKVYICSVPGCGHRYTRSDALTRHKSTAHLMKDSKTSNESKSKKRDENRCEN